MSALDELLAKWRANPDAESTLALCSYLGSSGREELIREVGTSAEAWHLNDAEVMLAVGRMYLDAGLLAEAQAALVTSGKGNARDWRAFRFLGEVLLRRGDAIRAEKVLARSMQLGQGDDETRLWHDRSVVYAALQKRVGPEAVAGEVARSLPRTPPAPPPAGSQPVAGSPGPAQHWHNDEPPTMPRPAGTPLPRGAVPNSAPVVPPAPAAPASVRQAPAPAAARPRSVRPPPAVQPPSARQPKSVPPPLPNWASSAGAAAQALVAKAEQPQQPAPLQSVPREPAPPHEPVLSPGIPLGGSEAQPAPPIMAAEEPYAEDDTATHVYDSPNPEPGLILQHLARVGVYEPGGGAPPAWEKASSPRTRGSWVFVLATVLLAGAGTGAYFYARKVKRERAELAAHLDTQIATMLESGRVDKLRATDDKLKRVFDLDSRSQRAARLWLKNRVLGLLLLPGQQQGVDSAIHRARKVNVPEKDLAYARIASFLADGDLAGAAALLPKWDKKAGDNALYQLLAGAALERAGDQRAIERYQAARDRDQKLVVAKVLLARLVLLEGGAEKGKPLVDALKKQIGNRPSTKALRALQWAVDPTRPKELPADAKLTDDEKKQLPQPLTPVPYMVDGLLAIQSGERELANEAIGKGVGLSESPAVATRLGFLAIQAGNEKLARKAALRALQFAAVYPGARVLASRVALLGGRISEAKKAIQELDPKAPEVAVVRAVIGYEALDPSELSEAVGALGDGASERPDLAALVAAPGVLSGEQYPDADALQQMATPTAPWGQIVALDAALDTGQLELAGKVVSGWSDDVKKRPVFALRLARLRRYQGKAEEAVKASGNALESGNVTARDLIERVDDLLDGHYSKGARELIAKYPSVLGPMTGFLQVLADANQHKANAKVKASQLDLPPDAAPLLLRTMAARALVAVGDKRAKKYLKALLKQHRTNPELLRAQKDL